MNEENTPFIYAVVSIIISLVIVVIIQSVSCTGAWAESGLKSKWGITSGCRVQLPSGQWMPASSIREIDIQVKKGDTK